MTIPKTETLEQKRNRREKIIIGGLFLISFIIQLVLTDFELKQSFLSALVQLLSSWILSFGFIQFRRKYFETNLLIAWRNWYIAIMVLSIISSFTF
jgi:uncharacterized membrane protein